MRFFIGFIFKKPDICGTLGMKLLFWEVPRFMPTQELMQQPLDRITQSETPSLGTRVEQYTGQSLGSMVEASIGQSQGQRVEASIAQVREGEPGPKVPATVTAVDLLRYLMIPGTCRGFRLLETAIELAVEDENRLLNVIDDLYPLVAQRHNATLNCVQKNMRMAIIAGWKNGGDKQLEKLIGIHYSARPVTKDFIDLLADYLRRRM